MVVVVGVVEGVAMDVLATTVDRPPVAPSAVGAGTTAATAAVDSVVVAVVVVVVVVSIMGGGGNGVTVLF